MASRYPAIKVVDYCYHPIHVVDDDKDIIVPCGKCDGCLLHSANEWSMRCGMEIEDSVCSIFGTLTYNNKYLPKLYPVYHGYEGSVSWISDHCDNIRFNSVIDVPRQDGIIINKSYSPIDIQNWDNLNYPSINYASKRDIQLWLKLIRKDLFSHGFTTNDKNGLLRYYVISEVGPTTFRNHYHFLLFFQSRTIAEYLIEGSLFKNWKMCDEDKFTPYCHFCDSGARGYVTQYLTSFSSVPRVYREVKEIRPFRLSSKSPAIGFVGQDKEKIFEDVSRGIIQYSRPLRRLESSSLLFYPKDYLLSLFPKCHGFSKISDSRRFIIYSFLYRAVRKYGYVASLLRKRLSSCLYSADYVATCACFRFCEENVNSPDYYYFLLDSYNYQLEIQHLRSFYESQQNVDFHKDPYKIFEFYPNIEVICNNEKKIFTCTYLALSFCLSPLGFDVDSLIGNHEFFLKVRFDIMKSRSDYFNEVSDIVDNMVKTSKFNELIGNSPAIV